MMPAGAGWAILFLPLASFLTIALAVRPLMGPRSPWAGYLTVLTIAGSFLLSLWALQSVVAHGEALPWPAHPWVVVGGLEFRVGLLMDPLTAVMVVVVSGVSLLIQVYSLGYMRGDPGVARYFAFMSLFTASMLGLVMARNILLLYVFWELVGLCSYLLIGFWYHRPAAARAAVKAFLVTRLGDFGFLLAILFLFFHRGAFAAQGLNPLEIPDIYQGVRMGLLGGTAATLLALGIFSGAMGKSAQFPLHLWLPDAMEGPTPVSALIHAATMVAAGVFLVARFFPLYEASPSMMATVALVGAFTALFAATMGMVMTDIKRVVAYSTISQLGYMFLGLGVGAYSAALFHLVTHAFFKALLFLGAGSAQHATGTFDLRYMGGLRRHQPWTTATFLAAALSLSGLFPLAGFWSKDEVLAGALERGGAVASLALVMGLVGVVFTAFYIFRAFFLAFGGEFRGGAEAEAAHNGRTAPSHGGVHLAESPAVMVAPMALLGLLSVVAGALLNPPVPLGPVPAHWLSSFLVPPLGEAEKALFLPGLAALSVLLALLGIGWAWALYSARRVPAEQVTPRRLYDWAVNRYYIDDLYERGLVGRVFFRGLCGALDWFDRSVVDGFVDGVGWVGRNLGRAVAVAQTGQVQVYGTAIALGVGLIILFYLLWG